MKNLKFGYSATPFGKCCIVFDGNTVFGLAFIDLETDFKPEKLIKARFTPDMEGCEVLARKVFIDRAKVEIQLVGTDFQIAVWRELLEIPCGETRTYRQIAQRAGRPAAVRAAANAVGDNRISYLVPCHRVIRTDGGIGGYRWGIDVKKQILMSENVIV